MNTFHDLFFHSVKPLIAEVNALASSRLVKEQIFTVHFLLLQNLIFEDFIKVPFKKCQCLYISHVRLKESVVKSIKVKD